MGPPNFRTFIFNNIMAIPNRAKVSDASNLPQNMFVTIIRASRLVGVVAVAQAYWIQYHYTQDLPEFLKHSFTMSSQMPRNCKWEGAVPRSLHRHEQDCCQACGGCCFGMVKTFLFLLSLSASSWWWWWCL